MNVIKYNCEISRSDLNKGRIDHAKCNKIIAKEFIDNKKQLDSLIQLLSDYYIDKNCQIGQN